MRNDKKDMPFSSMHGWKRVLKAICKCFVFNVLFEYYIICNKKEITYNLFHLYHFKECTLDLPNIDFNLLVNLQLSMHQELCSINLQVI